MIEYQEEVIAVLRQYNPWWSGRRQSDLPAWRRAAFAEIAAWIRKPPAGRALLLVGARQIGKTTLFLQTIARLLDEGVPASNILYVTFDHPLLKLAGIDGVLKLWREVEGGQAGEEYLFLDEVHSAEHWQVTIKHQVDFSKHRRIAMTGSAMPLVREGQESGVGRWYTVKLATLSFYEYLRIKNVKTPDLPAVDSLAQLMLWKPAPLGRVMADAQPLVAHFHEYLSRGGFPQCALADSVDMAQRMLREDIVDKVLKRDMTALFAVRRVLALERLFLYLCMHEGGLLDMQTLSSSLGAPRTTVEHYVDLFEATHLMYRLYPFGYGKSILRARAKAYLADAAIAPSVLLKGKSMVQDPVALGHAVETTFFKHVFARYYRQNIRFAYWNGSKNREVDIVAEIEGQLVPFEVKYRSAHIEASDLKGLSEFCRTQKVPRAYVVTKDLHDFGLIDLPDADPRTKVLRIPALLACYWLSRAELEGVGQ